MHHNGSSTENSQSNMSDMHFPTYNNADYIGIASQICLNMYFPTAHPWEYFTL